ncbi:MAG: sigma-70 family RNA polymerase sigma factor [Acidobacteria bacterium]|nr:MAG: sigma-70 family RNA polymerase sigma factor [Acidobacteriota bacterium]
MTVLREVELAAERAGDVPERAVVTRFPWGHAAEDGRFVRAARAGDQLAFERLYDRYARIVHGLLLARVPANDVDDLVQDVFLTAWRRLDDLRDPAAFGGWIAMIARNRALDFHRRSADEVSLPDDLPARGETGALAEANAILDVIRRLPEAYRDTLVLRLVEGLSGPEIAERTGLTAASVRVNLHRGMKQLREKLER